MVERVHDIAAAAVHHLQMTASRSGRPQQAQALAGFSVESVLAGISYFRIHDYTEQVGWVAGSRDVSAATKLDCPWW